MAGRRSGSRNHSTNAAMPAWATRPTQDRWSRPASRGTRAGSRPSVRSRRRRAGRWRAPAGVRSPAGPSSRSAQPRPAVGPALSRVRQTAAASRAEVAGRSLGGWTGRERATAALRRIAYLLERAREPTYRVRAFRSAAATVDGAAGGRAGAAGSRRHAQGAQGRRRRDGRGGRRGRGRRGTGVPRQARGRRPTVPVATGGDELRAPLRGDLHTHSDWSDGGSPIREMARAARDLGHEYVVLTDHSPRLTVANGLTARAAATPARRRRGAQRGAGAVPDPHRDRGRHPRGRLARPGAASCSAGSTSSWRSVHSKLRMPSARHDAADGGRDRQPAHRRPRPLHRPAASRRAVAAARCGRSPSSTPRSSSRPAGSSASRSRSTRRPERLDPPRAAARAGAGRRAACSPSTPTRTRRGSWSGRRTAARARRRARCRPSGWSNTRSARRAARLGAHAEPVTGALRRRLD